MDNKQYSICIVSKHTIHTWYNVSAPSKDEAMDVAESNYWGGETPDYNDITNDVIVNIVVEETKETSK